MIRQNNGSLLLACLGLILILILPQTTSAQFDPGMDLLTGIGYHTSGPYVLMGAELTRRIQDFGLGLRIANEMGTMGGTSTLSLRASGDWSHVRLPFYTVNVGVSAHVTQSDNRIARTIAIRGDGSYGNVRGNLSVGYVGGPQAAFPWNPEDLANVVAGEEAYYYFQGSVTAAVLPAHGLRWSQDVAWQRSISDDRTAMSFATGPTLSVGNGRISLQGGMVIGPSGLVPLTRLSYRVDSLDDHDSVGQLELSVDSTSLRGGGPVVQGAYTLEADWWKVQALIRLEQDDPAHPKLYFSILPVL